MRRILIGFLEILHTQFIIKLKDIEFNMNRTILYIKNFGN
jgi:hypothetical protein